jgi:hypothetical protein
VITSCQLVKPLLKISKKNKSKWICLYLFDF